MSSSRLVLSDISRCISLHLDLPLPFLSSLNPIAFSNHSQSSPIRRSPIDLPRLHPSLEQWLNLLIDLALSVLHVSIQISLRCRLCWRTYRIVISLRDKINCRWMNGITTWFVVRWFRSFVDSWFKPVLVGIWLNKDCLTVWPWILNAIVLS